MRKSFYLAAGRMELPLAEMGNTPGGTVSKGRPGVQFWACIQATICAGSASMDSTNHGSKIFVRKKFQKVPKNNINLPCTGSCLHNIYIVFIIIYIAFTLFSIISNLEMI